MDIKKNIKNRVYDYFKRNSYKFTYKEEPKNLDKFKEYYVRDDFPKKPNVEIKMNIPSTIKDEKTFLSEKTKKLIKKYRKEFELFYCEEKIYKKYKEEFDKDPLLSRKRAIYKAYKNDWKGIYAKSYDGTIKFVDSLDDKYIHGKYSDNLKNILEENFVFCQYGLRKEKIPIFAIEKITNVFYGENYYNTNNFPEFKYTLKQLQQDYINLKSYQSLPKKYFTKDIIKKILKEDLMNYYACPKKFFDDKNFIVEILEKIPTAVIFFNYEISKDIDFEEKILNIIKKSPEAFETYFKFQKDDFYDFYRINKYLKNINEICPHYTSTFLDKCLTNMDCSINDSFFIKFLKKTLNLNGELLPEFNKTIAEKINDLNLYTFYFSKESILLSIDDLPIELENRKEYIMYLLDNIKNINHAYALKNCCLDESQNNDFDITKKIIKFVDDSYINDFLHSVKINIENIEQIYELASINCSILNILTNQDKIIFLTDEFSEYKNINIENDYIKFKTTYGTFQIKNNKIKYIDDNNHELNIDNSINNKILKNILDILNEKKIFIGNNINEFKECLKNNDLERES